MLNRMILIFCFIFSSVTQLSYVVPPTPVSHELSSRGALIAVIVVLAVVIVLGILVILTYLLKKHFNYSGKLYMDAVSVIRRFCYCEKCHYQNLSH